MSSNETMDRTPLISIIEPYNMEAKMVQNYDENRVNILRAEFAENTMELFCLNLIVVIFTILEKTEKKNPSKFRFSTISLSLCLF